MARRAHGQFRRMVGRQLIAAAWVKESTALHVKASDMAEHECEGVGYGYLWWKPSESRQGLSGVTHSWPSGNFGQYLLVFGCGRVTNRRIRSRAESWQNKRESGWRRSRFPRNCGHDLSCPFDDSLAARRNLATIGRSAWKEGPMSANLSIWLCIVSLCIVGFSWFKTYAQSVPCAGLRNGMT